MDKRLLGATVLVLLAACSADRTTAPPTTGQISDAVTSDLAAELDANGQFKNLAREQAGELTALKATALAVTYAKQWGALREEWAQQHGSPIDYAQIQACGRALYAVSSYEPVSAEMIRPVRSIFSNWWVVTLCQDGQRVMAVSVSAIATDLSIQDGAIVYPFARGMEFEALGIPAAAAGGGIEYRNPEEEVVRGFAKTGKRVRGVPVLIAGRRGVALALAGSWRLDVEDSVRVRGARSGKQRAATQVYLGRLGAKAADGTGAVTDTDELMLPAEVQPDEDEFTGFRESDMRPGQPGFDPPPVRGAAKRASGTPLVFENVTVNN